jgi:hypothetical protein
MKFDNETQINELNTQNEEFKNINKNLLNNLNKKETLISNIKSEYSKKNKEDIEKIIAE